MKIRKINTPLILHLSYMCEFIDDYHDICKFSKELIQLGFSSKALDKLSDISKNKDIQNFDKNYSEFINEYNLSEITYKNANIIFFKMLSKEYLDNEISLDEYMENFYYLYYVSHSGLQSDNFSLNKSIRELNELYKDYKISNINIDEVSLKKYNEKTLATEQRITSLLSNILNQ